MDPNMHMTTDSSGSGMDMSTSGMDMGDMGDMDNMGMHNYFYAGDTVTVLFKGWATKDTGSLIGSMIAIMVIAALYEVLKFFREKIHFSSHKQMHEAQISRSACSAMMMKAHIIQTLLHAVQMFVSFSLMLVFMTYNAWLCISVILGGTIGYFLCGWRRHTMVHELDDCH